jgi:hypothetical protein
VLIHKNSDLFNLLLLLIRLSGIGIRGSAVNHSLNFNEKSIDSVLHVFPSLNVLADRIRHASDPQIQCLHHLTKQSRAQRDLLDHVGRRRCLLRVYFLTAAAGSLAVEDSSGTCDRYT